MTDPVIAAALSSEADRQSAALAMVQAGGRDVGAINIATGCPNSVVKRMISQLATVSVNPPEAPEPGAPLPVAPQDPGKTVDLATHVPETADRDANKIAAMQLGLVESKCGFRNPRLAKMVRKEMDRRAALPQDLRDAADADPSLLEQTPPAPPAPPAPVAPASPVAPVQHLGEPDFRRMIAIMRQAADAMEALLP